MTVPDEINTRLKIRIGSCPVEHYLVGNPHTFRGRIATWCPLDSVEVNVSKYEILASTDAAALWIEGFLAGSEPPPPDSDDPVAERDWANVRRYFRVHGDMPR